MSEVVTLVMPAKTEYLILARLALAGIARGTPISESVLADLKLAVTEACGNSVRHAYPSNPGVVRVRYEVNDGAIEIVVEDEGAGSEASLWVEPTAGQGPAESGMGLAIIRAIVDELDIGRRRDATGTVVRMRKRLASE
jgi:serine/threonine-protein kinase RsbW